MRYENEVILKDGRKCCLRNAEETDGQAVYDNYVLTHEQTDYLTCYVDEIPFTVEQESAFLKAKAESEREVEIMAVVGGTAVGLAGVGSLGDRYKTGHRAVFGISVDRDYWGLGIGTALMDACIECARKAGYEQLELEVVGENETAMAMYRKAGFVEYGRNPKGFRSRISGYQELVSMRKEL